MSVLDCRSGRISGHVEKADLRPAPPCPLAPQRNAYRARPEQHQPVPIRLPALKFLIAWAFFALRRTDCAPIPIFSPARWSGLHSRQTGQEVRDRVGCTRSGISPTRPPTGNLKIGEPTSEIVPARPCPSSNCPPASIRP